MTSVSAGTGSPAGALPHDSPRNGSHVFDPGGPTADGVHHEVDQDHLDDVGRSHPGTAPAPEASGSTNVSAPRSGSSAAYARLTAARRTPSAADTDAAQSTRPAGVTLLRSGGANMVRQSADDVSTSTLPIISYGS